MSDTEIEFIWRFVASFSGASAALALAWAWRRRRRSAIIPPQQDAERCGPQCRAPKLCLQPEHAAQQDAEVMVVHHHDIEKHAEHFNEGFAEALRQAAEQDAEPSPAELGFARMMTRLREVVDRKPEGELPMVNAKQILDLGDPNGLWTTSFSNEVDGDG